MGLIPPDGAGLIVDYHSCTLAPPSKSRRSLLYPAWCYTLAMGKLDKGGGRVDNYLSHFQNAFVSQLK